MKQIQSFQDLHNINIADVIVRKGEDLIKKRRFSIGCGVSECEIQELLYISEILCRKEEVCYITKEEGKQITERINGK